ncbi:MAG: hypothetical protein U1A78_22210 [Polyangia bacterium]
MLHPWIIEQIRKREEEERGRREQRPHVDMPYRPPTRKDDGNRYGDDDRDQPPGKDRDRGVVIIDL